MKYPKYLNKYGYCNILKMKYEKEYIGFFSICMIENTINYIVSNIIGLISQTNEATLIKVIKYLFSLEQITKEEYLEAIKEINQKNICRLLFGASKKFMDMAEIIAFQAGVSITDANREKYLEFLQSVTIQSTKELALVNQPKSDIGSRKKITFSENVASMSMVREFETGEDLAKHKELEGQDKEQWLNRKKQDFKAYYKKERQRDLQCKENTASEFKKPKID